MKEKAIFLHIFFKKNCLGINKLNNIQYIQIFCMYCSKIMY